MLSSRAVVRLGLPSPSLAAPGPPKKWARTVPKGSVLVVEGRELPTPKLQKAWWQAAVKDPVGFMQETGARGALTLVMRLGALGVRPNTYKGYWSCVLRLLVWKGWGLDVSDDLPPKVW